jgi:hypothetical protein
VQDSASPPNTGTTTFKVTIVTPGGSGGGTTGGTGGTGGTAPSNSTSAFTALTGIANFLANPFAPLDQRFGINRPDLAIPRLIFSTMGFGLVVAGGIFIAKKVEP